MICKLCGESFLTNEGAAEHIAECPVYNAEVEDVAHWYAENKKLKQTKAELKMALESALVSYDYLRTQLSQYDIIVGQSELVKQARATLAKETL